MISWSLRLHKFEVHKTGQNILARIIIVAYNSGNDLQNCLNALEAQSDRRFEVVIVDNASPDKCVQALGTLPSYVTVITSINNLGFAAGCNLGARGAQTQWLITLNPDTIPNPDWFHELSLCWARDGRVDLWGCKQLNAQRPDVLDGFGDVLSIFGMAWRGGYGQPAESAPYRDVRIFGPCAAAAAYKRQTYEHLGGFDPAYFCYLEDVDLAMRFNLAGKTSRIAHKAIVHHVGGTSTAAQPEFPIFQASKNNVYFLIKTLPIFWLVICLPLFFTIQLWVRFRNRKDGYHDARVSGHKAGRKLWALAWKNRKTVERRAFSGFRLWPIMCKSYFKFRKRALFYTA